MNSRKEPEALLAGIRREFHDATHHCYAYRIGARGEDYRFNDDGEPSGTAGKPILSAIDRRGVTNLLVVVTRYFGGTKLGRGGLARAYGEAAGLSLDRAVIVTRYETVPIRISFPAADMGRVTRIIGRFGLDIRGSRYDDEAHLFLSVRQSVIGYLGGEITEATAGRGRVEPEQE